MILRGPKVLDICPAAAMVEIVGHADMVRNQNDVGCTAVCALVRTAVRTRTPVVLSYYGSPSETFDRSMKLADHLKLWLEALHLQTCECGAMHWALD